LIGDRADGQRSFKGKIDEVKIWRRVLDPSEFNMPVVITDSSPLPSGEVDRAYSYQLHATGGAPPYPDWQVTGGALPVGLGLDGGTGLISGTSTASGTATFTVQVRDSVSSTASKEFQLTITSDLVGHWPFDTANGSTPDSSDLHNDGIIHGSELTAGSMGNALLFDGGNDYVEVPHQGAYGGMNGITIEAWINWSGAGDGYQRIVDKTYDHQYAFYVNPSNRYLGVALVTDASKVDWWNSGAAVPTNEWVHVAFTWDGATDTLKLYVGGVERASRALSGVNVADYNTALLIGDRADGQRSFKGKIDEVKIWRRVLDPSEFNPLSTGSTLSLMASEFDLGSIIVTPNPVRDRALFKAEGVGIESVRVLIYDLAGRNVFASGWQDGRTVEWDCTNDDGEILANGVYLYTMLVRGFGGTQKKSPVGKLVLLR
jgi:hypothetical protein